MDTLSLADRSKRMALVRCRDTKPELRVRRAAHARGLRYRLGGAGLPGHPDLVFPRWKVALFVHGCFWHRHEGCPLARWPKSRPEFWLPKLEENRRRDITSLAHLRVAGWRAEVIWECETRTLEAIEVRLASIFGVAE